MGSPPPDEYDEDIRLKVGDRVDSRWQILRKLGQGGFGAVYETLDARGQVKGPKALKVESVHCKDQVLKIEVAVLTAMRGTKHKCKMYACGKNDKFNFIIMTLLGQAICTLRKKCFGEKFSQETTMMILIQCLEALKNMHDVGWVHRDVKPSNFAMGQQDAEAKRTVFMIDFGLSRLILQKDNTLRAAREVVGFRGTLRFCSVNAHRGKELGKHDDLISLLYMMIEMLTGNVPWKGLMGNKEIEACKVNAATWMFDLLPSSFKDVHQHLSSLLYEDTPPYRVFEEAVYDAFPKNKMKRTPFDWEMENTQRENITRLRIHQAEQRLKHKFNMDQTQRSPKNESPFPVETHLDDLDNANLDGKEDKEDNNKADTHDDGDENEDNDDNCHRDQISEVVGSSDGSMETTNNSKNIDTNSEETNSSNNEENAEETTITSSSSDENTDDAKDTAANSDKLVNLCHKENESTDSSHEE